MTGYGHFVDKDIANLFLFQWPYLGQNERKKMKAHCLL